MSGIFNPFKGETETPSAEVTSTAVDRDPTTGRFLKPGLSGTLVAKAKRLGITDDDLRDMDASDLREEVRSREFDAKLEKVLNVRATMDRVQAEARESVRNTPQPEHFDVGLTEETANPEIIAAFKRMQERYEKKIADLEKAVGETSQHVKGQVQREEQSFARRVEKCFSKHPAIFGDGPIDKLDQSSPEFHFRLAAVAAHRTNGGLPEDLESNIDQFVDSKFARRKAKPAVEEPDEDVDEAAEWEAGVLGRPTTAGPREAPDGYEKALAGVRSRMAPFREKKTRAGTRGQFLNHKPSQAQGNGQR
jgi:hypothetical protein